MKALTEAPRLARVSGGTDTPEGRTKLLGTIPLGRVVSFSNPVARLPENELTVTSAYLRMLRIWLRFLHPTRQPS